MVFEKLLEEQQSMEQSKNSQIKQPTDREAILYICHGSRLKQAQEQAIAFVQSLMSEKLAPIQEYCFLELAHPIIEEAFRACVEKGATKIIAIPLLLLTAAHAKEDIPNELISIKKQYPDVNVAYGQPIGVHPSISAILHERIMETKQSISSDSMVLLVGRGSSDPEVKHDLSQIAQSLKQYLQIDRVDTSFLVAAKPSLDEALQIVQDTKYKKVFVIPYLLFTGVLMNKIAKMIRHHNEQTDQEYILCKYLGYHPFLNKIIKDRIMDAKKLPE